MKKIFIAAAGLMFMMVSCSTSRVISSWKSDKSYNIKKVLVLGLTGEADRAFCVKMEKHLADDLALQNYNTFAAYEQYGSHAFDKLSESEAIDKIRNKGFDAVLTIVLLNKQKEKYFVPGRIRSVSPYHERFWDYYTTRYDRIYRDGYYGKSEGYYESTVKYFWESNLYDLNSNTLIYSSQTESFDPGSAESLGHEYGKLIAANMVAKGVLPTASLKAF